jgi:Holliday junction resolvase
MSPEVKLYKDLKKNTPNILWNRIENLSLLGMPDLLGYNKKQHFFTVELKVAKGSKIKFSPHQIAWHKTHSKNRLRPSTRPPLKLIQYPCSVVQV